MQISSSASFQCNCLRGMQCIDAATALHQVIAVDQKRLGFLGLIQRVQHSIGLAPWSSKSSCTPNHSIKWRKLMLTLMPSLGVGLVGSMLTAIALAADWYIWNFRYRISWHRGPELAPPPDGTDVIHVPSASGRELVVNLAPQSLAPQSLERNIPPTHQFEGEWLHL